MGILHKLNNGLRIYADPMPSLETIALGVWSHAGSVNENDNEHGLAHLLEHMAFKGTSRRTARQIAEEIENAGGYLNAATSHQRTGYHVRLLRNDLNLGLDILSDILLDPALAQDELAKEQEVVIQEIGEAADTPDDVVFEMLQAATWGDHPLSRPILGTPATVRSQTPGSLKGFMDRWYRPANMAIAVAGAVDADAFFKQCEIAFANIDDNDVPEAPGAAEFVGAITHDARQIEQTHMALSFPGISVKHDDFFATRIFADALGGGMSSRLFQTIREERGLAYSVYAFADGYEECGLTGAYVGADHNQIAETAKLIRGEIEAMTSDVTQAEIDRARALLKSSLMMSLENPAARIDAAAGQLFTFDRIIEPDELTNRLDAVTLDDVKRCAARAANGGQFALSVVGPGDADDAARAFG